jgi:Holliday junction resolvasome RuvABC DNA-binding subunit
LRTQDPRELGVRQTVLSALCHLGFRRRQAALAIDAAVAHATELGAEGLLRAALGRLVPG